MLTKYVKVFFCDVKWFISKYKTLLLSFFIPVVILEIAYIVQGVFPFGSNDVLIIDLYHQYAPFLLELRKKMLSFSSLLYTWTGGLGTSFLSLFGYYLASPLNFFIIFFPESLLSEAVLFLILLKTGLAGAAFAWFLNGVHKEDNLAIPAFATLYALSGYMLAYSWNIMWLDCLYLLPVIILGLVRLVRDGRGLLFCVSFALAIFSNFYIAFFIGIFLVLYFPVCLFQYHGIRQPKLLLKKVAAFAGYSLLAAGLTAILVLPTWYALKLTSAAGEIIPKDITHYFDLFDYISRHLTLASPSIREGMANIYCGIVVLILLPIYFMSPAIRHKEKLWHGALMLVLVASFNTNILDFIWHGFHFPNQLPFRNSFVYIFLVLSMAYPAYRSLGSFSRKQTGAVCLGVMALVILSQKLGIKDADIYTAYACLPVIAGYAAVLTIKRRPRAGAYAAALFFLLMVVAEATFNTIMVINKIDIDESYSSRYGYSSGQIVAKLRETIDEIAENEKGFYRVEVMPPRTTNDPFLYGYRGLSIFASTFPEKPVRLIEKLGYHSNSINSYKYEGSTIVLDALFSIKYLVRRDASVKHVLREPVVTSEDINVYKNPYVLSPGFVVPKEMKEWKTYAGNPFEVQNNFIKAASGFGGALTSMNTRKGTAQNLTFKNNSGTYYGYTRNNKSSESMAEVIVDIEKDGEIYLYVDVTTGNVKYGHALVDGERVDFNATRSTIVDLGYLKAGSKVELKLFFKENSPESGSFRVYAYSLEEESFYNAFSELSKRQLEVESFTDSTLTGTINAAFDGIMLMTVPFDPGWNVMVDGQRVETFAIADCFLAFGIPAGKHEMEMSYVPPKFYAGLSVTLVSLFIVIALFKKRRCA